MIILAFIEEFSLTDLAIKLGVTKSRVCQIRARALRSLRKYLVEHEVSGANEAEIA
ncbi:MAG TPA: sigma factor-like helix-turn-helix DNA-binding protein [Acidimicrobiales bacterium]|nr:sigma factor-like helix-turn-helix DNA-binding protein [Acidimicrobiales bacterium]